MTTLFIGDLHGCIAELQELCEGTLYASLSAGNSCIFLGDLFDRGPDSLGVVRLVRELMIQYPTRVDCLLGNHDEWYLRYSQHEQAKALTGKKNLMTTTPEKIKIFQTLSSEDLDWLAKRPVYIATPSWLAVHAGIPEGVVQREQLISKRYRQRALRLRDIDDDGKMLALGQSGTPWADRYDGRFGKVIYGHQARVQIRRSAYAFGIDTGCCFGDALTALELNDRGEEILVHSVPAKKVYSQYIESEE